MVNPEELRKIKDQAARALAKGNLDKALEKFEVLVKAQPKDLRLKMKLGDILVKLKKNDEAFQTYEEVAEAYTADKFLIQAVSIYKIIQQLDPNRPGIAEKLEALNQARGIPAVVPRPEAAPPDSEPGLAAQIEEAKQKEKERQDAAAPMPISEIPLFGKLGEEEFRQVVSRFQVGRIPKKTIVIKEGTRGDSFFIVAQGDVRVYRTDAKTERKITLGHISDGGFFGEMAFFLDSIRSASCETAEDTTLLRINRQDLTELMREYPRIREVMRDFFKRRALDQLLKTMNLFSSLEDAEREVLINRFELREADPGAILVQEGEEGKYLYLIFAGEVEVTTQHEEKGPVKLATLGKGDYFGEISLVQGKLNTADVTASTRAVLFTLPKAVFKELLAIHSPMLEELGQVIERRLKSTVDALLKA